MWANHMVPGEGYCRLDFLQMQTRLASTADGDFLQPVLDRQLQPLELLDAKYIRPASLQLGTQFTVEFLVKLHQSK